MLTTDERYLEIVKSNVRPKIEPYITVSGEDADGNEIELQWKPSNIIELSYKRGIDPTGQTLPYMELTWKEFYFGKLNENNYPEKYNNIVKYMKVDLYFRQDTSKINTWGDVLGGIGGGDVEVVKTTWDDFSSDTWNELTGTWDNPAGSSVSVVSEENYTWGDYTPKTWGDIFRSNTFVDIELPSLILTAKPTIQGHTITWVARDLLYFLNGNVEKAFDSSDNLPFKNPLKWVILNEQLNFSNSPEIFNLIKRSAEEIDATESDNSKLLDEMVVLRGLTKDVLKNYASIRNYYLNFSYGRISINKFNDLIKKKEPAFSFTTKVMRSYPKLTPNLGISTYSFKRYFHYLDKANTVRKEATIGGERIDGMGNAYQYAEYDYGSLGTSNLEYFDDVITNKGYYIGNQFLGYPDEITVTPLKTSSTVENILNSVQGEVYVEDNPINPYDKNSDYIWEKLDAIEDWYSKRVYSMEVESLHNVALEPGDRVEIETNLCNDDNTNIIKNAIVVGLEFQYVGTLKQKTFLHEVI